MPLSESDILVQGEGCSRGKYIVTRADLEAIAKKLDEIDGDNPSVTYSVDAIRKNLAGGSKSSAGCMVYYLNRVIGDNEDLSRIGIFLHTHKTIKGEGIRFDRNAPSRQEAEEPSGGGEGNEGGR
jgi:hypothetical protein